MTPPPLPGAWHRRAFYVLVFALRDLFPVSFYGRDARERLRTLAGSLRSCVSTVLNLATLTLLVVSTGLVAALYTGTVGWLRDYVESNPLARTVEVSATLGVGRTAFFDPQALDALRGLAATGEAAPVASVHGWNDVTFWFFDALGAEDDELTHGRTVDPSDPVLARLDYLAGDGGFTGDGVGQVVVSRTLLRTLGHDGAEAWPERLRLEYHGSAAPVEVVGVADDTPAGEVLITEGFHRAIQDRRWDPRPRIPGLYLGPVEPTPALEQTLDELASFFAGRGVSAGVERRAGTERWLAVRREPPWTEEQWRQLFLPVVHKRLATVAPGARVELFEPRAPELEPRQALEPRYARASVYVRRLADVPAVAEAAAALGYQVTSNSRELALLFLQVSALGRGILLAVILVVGTLAALSLVLSFSQDIQRKTPEIAILKAYGASSPLVLGIYVLEALVLWAVAVAVGSTVAAWVAGAVDERLVALLRLRGDLPAVGETSLVAMPWEVLAAVAAGALVLCVGATLLAGSLAVRLQPAGALSLHR